MSVDSLQEKIRKTKNPSVLELAMAVSDLPPQFSQNAEGYAAFCRELMEHLQDDELKMYEQITIENNKLSK